ncbi:MAG: hypothetical protein AVDCRST_MAG87-3654, partial [uncultured Thermomicrobiales bacterium]
CSRARRARCRPTSPCCRSTRERFHTPAIAIASSDPPRSPAPRESPRRRHVATAPRCRTLTAARGWASSLRRTR